MSDFERVSDIAGRLPGAEPSMSWGTPSFKVRTSMFLRQHEDPDLIVLKVAREEREALVSERPATFIVTPHYENYAYMLVRTADLDDRELGELIADAWRMVAPKRAVKAYDEGSA